MYKITGFAVVNAAEGKRISYSYSKIDDATGNVVESNVRKSFIPVDQETLDMIKQLETKVNANLEAAI